MSDMPCPSKGGYTSDPEPEKWHGVAWNATHLFWLYWSACPDLLEISTWQQFNRQPVVEALLFDGSKVGCSCFCWLPRWWTFAWALWLARAISRRSAVKSHPTKRGFISALGMWYVTHLNYVCIYTPKKRTVKLLIARVQRKTQFSLP